MTDNIDMEYRLDMQVKRNQAKKSIFLSQEKYIHDVLIRFHMVDYKSISTPLEAGVKFPKSMIPSTPSHKH